MSVSVIILLVILAFVFVTVSSYNSLVSGRNKCDEAFSTMDVYLKKRFDLIPNLVATVKGYSKHEAETLEKIIKARNATSSVSVQELSDSENKISSAMRQIFALSESYPELKADESFRSLMSQLKSLEDDITNARKYYNAVVKLYNDKCQMIPTNIIAGMFNFKTRALFTVDDSAERKNVTVEF